MGGWIGWIPGGVIKRHAISARFFRYCPKFWIQNRTFLWQLILQFCLLSKDHKNKQNIYLFGHLISSPLIISVKDAQIEPPAWFCVWLWVWRLLCYFWANHRQMVAIMPSRCAAPALEIYLWFNQKKEMIPTFRVQKSDGPAIALLCLWLVWGQKEIQLVKGS